MSELTNTHSDRSDFRWRLLTTVSAAALLASVCTVPEAKAADGDSARPPLWIDLGGQFAQQENDQAAFIPPFVLTTPRPSFITGSPTEVEKPRHRVGTELRRFPSNRPELTGSCRWDPLRHQQPKRCLEIRKRRS